MGKTVVGLLDSFEEARELIDDLLDNGFSQEAIGLIAREPEFGDAQAAAREEQSDEQISGVTKGFGAGAAVGGVAGLVIGIAAFTIPGIGAVVAAGPIAAALAGIGLGALTGGVYGAIRNLGVPEEEATYYAEGVQRGGVLVTVETDDYDAERAKEVMYRHGAVDIQQRAEEWRNAGWEVRPGQGPAEDLSPREPDH
jgi:uncharacterized membrane protein